MLKNKALATAVLLAACVGAVFVFRAVKPKGQAPKSSIEVRAKGDKSAPIHITEYFDYQCPPCGNAHRAMSEKMSAHPDRYYLELRYFPLPGHQNALKAAVHAECALRQGFFWEFHDKLFSGQPEWAMDPYAELRFLNYAKDIGVDLKKWDACTKDAAVAEFILAEKKQGEAIGVQTTPSVFVNGKFLVGNIPFMEELRQLESKEDSAP